MSSALDIQQERARAITRELVARAPAGSIACIFAGGSLGRGEVWAAEFDGTLDVYSDIDLYVIATPGAAVLELRRVASALVSLPAPDGVRFQRGADIGVYTPADLAAQPLRPGTAELDTRHLLLFGDDSIARALPGREAARIPVEEALYLLENRALELSAAPAGAGPEGRLVLAQALKARLDVYAAHAIVAGTFAPTLAERARRFSSETPSTLDDAAREQVAAAFEAASDIGSWMRTRDAATERETALAAVVDAWRTLAPRVLRLPASPAELVARRCRAGDMVANGQEIVRIRHATGASLLRAASALPRLAALSPVAALRIDALARILAAASGADNDMASHFAYVDRLTQHFGFTNGTPDERVRRMYAAIS